MVLKSAASVMPLELYDEVDDKEEDFLCCSIMFHSLSVNICMLFHPMIN